MKKVIIQKGVFLDKIAYINDDVLQRLKIVNKSQKYFENDVFIAKKKRQNLSMKSSAMALDSEMTGFIQGQEGYDADSFPCQIKKIFANEKNPKLSKEITLSGRYVVFIGGSSGLSISNKAFDKSLVDELKDKINDITIQKAKIIIRSNVRFDELANILLEIEEFENVYDNILQKSKLISKPQMIYRQYESEERFLSKINTEVDILITNDKQSVKMLLKSRFAPREVVFEEENLFTKYGIDTEITKLLEDKVKMKNGINLFIQSTEAMTIIDVNSAGFFKYKDFSQNAYHVNNLVCEEIVRQICLRDLSGVILIDFIDMKDNILSEKLRQHLYKCLEKDDRKSTVSILSKSDIIQIIRKKEDITLKENLTDMNLQLKNIAYLFEEVDRKISNIIRDDMKKLSVELPIFESVKANSYLSILEKKYGVKLSAKYLKKDDFNVKIEVES